MPSVSDPTKLSSFTVEALFTEICTDIRETDSTSFRLLGLVPLVSGTALLTVMLSKGVPAELVMLLGIFGAGITLGLFRWELRNIQTCSWLLRRAELIQTRSLGIAALDPLCKGRPLSPQGIGKTAAEKLIYSLTIATWLAMPICLASINRLTNLAGSVYAGVALLILGSTVVSLCAEAHFLLNVPSRAEAEKARDSVLQMSKDLLRPDGPYTVIIDLDTGTMLLDNGQVRWGASLEDLDPSFAFQVYGNKNEGYRRDKTAEKTLAESLQTLIEYARWKSKLGKC